MIDNDDYVKVLQDVSKFLHAAYKDTDNCTYRLRITDNDAYCTIGMFYNQNDDHHDKAFRFDMYRDKALFVYTHYINGKLNVRIKEVEDPKNSVKCYEILVDILTKWSDL